MYVWQVILSLRSEGVEIYNVEAVLNSSMRAAGILGEILNPDNMDNKSGGEESRLVRALLCILDSYAITLLLYLEYLERFLFHVCIVGG